MIDPRADVTQPRLHVESHADKLVRRHVVKVSRDTVLVRIEDGRQRGIGGADLVKLGVKTWVRLWFSPAGRDQYPLEVTAQRLEVVDRP